MTLSAKSDHASALELQLEQPSFAFAPFVPSRSSAFSRLRLACHMRCCQTTWTPPPASLFRPNIKFGPPTTAAFSVSASLPRAYNYGPLFGSACPAGDISSRHPATTTHLWKGGFPTQCKSLGWTPGRLERAQRPGCCKNAANQRTFSFPVPGTLASSPHTPPATRENCFSWLGNQ